MKLQDSKKTTLCSDVKCSVETRVPQIIISIILMSLIHVNKSDVDANGAFCFNAESTSYSYFYFKSTHFC